MPDYWPWQREEVFTHGVDIARALYWDPRTGKTRATVGSLNRLIEEKGAKKILVIAPQLVCSEVWESELDGLTTVALYSGPIKDRVAWVKNLTKNPPPHPIVNLVNWDVIARKELLDALLKWAPDVVVADELHYAKSAGTARSRALHRLGRVAKYRRGLTGTPTPNNYIDAYSQYKYLQPGIFGTSKEKFIERYVELDFWGRPKRYLHLPELRKKMFSIASRVDRRIVWKDRAPLEIVRKIELPHEARELYDRIVEQSIADYGGLEIDATHKLTQIVKLQQLTAGFISDGEEIRWVHDSKIKMAFAEIKDLLASDQKVVIFYHFAPEGKRYEQEIETAFGKIVGRIGGGTPQQVRKTLQERFRKEDSDLRIMLMQDSLGIGISLKSASYCIRTSYPLDYAAFVQSNDRIYEPGKALTYIQLEADRTVDKFGRDIVHNKEQALHRLLDVGFEKALRGQ